MDLAPPPADAAPSSAPPPPIGDGGRAPAGIVGGVAALLAERLGVDALWLRITFVLLALVGGVGLVLYGALWLVFVVGADEDRRWARLAGGAVLVGGLPLVLTQGFDLFSGPVAVLALLVGLAAALWQPRREFRPAAPSPDAVIRPARGTGPIGGDDVAASGHRRLPSLPRRAPRPPSILGRLVLGVALVVAAGGALIDEANGARLHPEQWLGGAAAVCGVGLVVGAFRGRARWLIVPAAILAGTGFVAGEAARTGIEPTALVGDEHVWIGDGSSGPRREHVVLGTVDVSIDAAPAAPVTVDARAGIGEVRIWAADDVTVEVDAGVRRGHVDVDGVRRPDGTLRIGPEGPADVVVRARVGRGSVHVEQWRRDAFVPPVPLPPPGPERFVAEGVLLTAGGQLVIAGGEAVIGRDDTVLTGTTVVRDRATVITTSFGDFRLLPGGLLLTPDGTLVDLAALRAELVPLDAPAASTPATPATPATPGAPDTPAPPVTTPGG